MICLVVLSIKNVTNSKYLSILKSRIELLIFNKFCCYEFNEKSPIDKTFYSPKDLKRFFQVL